MLKMKSSTFFSISLIVLFAIIAVRSGRPTRAPRCFDRWGRKCMQSIKFCKYDDYKNFWCRRTCKACGGTGTVAPTKPPPTNPPTGPPTGPTNVPPTKSTEMPPIQPVKCGQSQLQTGKVIGGSDAIPNSWPWQILLMFHGKPACGGAIIDPYNVITAAHCVDVNKRDKTKFSIRTGEHNLNKADTDIEQEYKVKEIIIHENWDTYRTINDIALLKLDRPIHLDKYATPICIPDEDVRVGTDCYLTGWGKIRHPGTMHSILQQAKMPVVDSRICDIYNDKATRIPITHGMVCAGHGGKTKVSGCHGDSGGPLVCFDSKKKAWLLHGVVSHGSPICDARETYTVFSRVSHYKSWIENKTK